MRHLPLLALLVLGTVALLTPFAAPVAGAQAEPTPIFGDPVVVTPVSTTAPEPEATPAATATARSGGDLPARSPAAEPDACEPNDTAARACALPLDAISGPFTIAPDSDQDFFRLDLPQEVSIQTVVTVRATAGLELTVTARQAEALVASSTFSLTLAPSITGPVILRVENRDPRPAGAEQYRIEVRREIAPPRPAVEGAQPPVPDALENNWSFATAAAVAVGVVYDLSFACPDPRPNACPGGDHDYLLVPVKAGVGYLVTTFDLDPGVDTVVELFWGATTTATVGNDDYAPGGALSALVWTAPADGLLGVRVAPRTGGLPLRLAEAKTGYRFAVAPLASELARKLAASIRQQANVPTPTPTITAPAAASSGAAGGSGAVPATGRTAEPEAIAAGPAIILRETVLRHAPNERSTALATLAPETRVSVRGPVNGLWISVEAAASILPGWVRWSDLQRVDEDGAPVEGAPAPPGSAGVMPSPLSQQPGAATPTTAPPTAAPAGGETHLVSVTALDPVLPPAPPPPAARVPFALAVIVVATDRPPLGGSTLGFATPTPDLRQPVARVRLQLLTVFGDLLAEGLTDVAGTAQLRHAIRPGEGLRVRIPAWGVELPLAPAQTSLVITIPEAQR